MNILEAINEQVNFELESAYIYKSMEAWMNGHDMPGFEHFMNMQVQEEVFHAEKMKSFLQEVDFQVKYRPLDPGTGEYESILDVFEKALDHEKLVSSKINALYDQAVAENERRALNMLQWFIDEQVEEEATFSTLVRQLERAGDNWGALLMLDNQMGQRVAPQPPVEEQN